jgi:hypothetical protein
MLWNVPYLEGHSLFGYITGETLAPPKVVASSTNTSTPPVMVPNPTYTTWYQQDKLILNTLILTLTEPILAHVVGLKTSREVWLTLERLFASESKARVMQLRYQLATLKKGALPIVDYFQKAKMLAQTLARSKSL